MSGPKITEGHIDFKIGSETVHTWYHIIGEIKSRRPLVVLHGGPGANHHYLLGLADLAAKHNIPVILYDQIGGGNSTHLKDKPKDFWKPSLFMDELDNVLKHFDIEKDFDLLGHSWGGMLGSQYAATRNPKGLKRLIVTNSPASMQLWEEACCKLLAGMPGDVQNALKSHDHAESKEYKEALGKFYAKHMIRIEPKPEDFQATFKKLQEDPTVQNTMIGPSPFQVLGNMKGWTVIDELHKIGVPTLLLNGKFDEAQDACAQPFFDRIPKVKWLTFENSSHLPMWEERERFMEIVSCFLLN